MWTFLRRDTSNELSQWIMIASDGCISDRPTEIKLTLSFNDVRSGTTINTQVREGNHLLLTLCRQQNKRYRCSRTRVHHWITWIAAGRQGTRHHSK